MIDEITFRLRKAGEAFLKSEQAVLGIVVPILMALGQLVCQLLGQVRIQEPLASPAMTFAVGLDFKTGNGECPSPEICSRSKLRALFP